MYSDCAFLFTIVEHSMQSAEQHQNLIIVQFLIIAGSLVMAYQVLSIIKGVPI